MLIKSYILFVCYVPVLFSLFPKVDGDINIVWFVFFLLPFGILIHSVIKQKLNVLNTWMFILVFYSFVVSISILWSDYRSYDLFTIKRLFAHLLVPIVVSIGALNLFSEQSNVRDFMRHIAFAALILSAISVYQYISRSGDHAQVAIARYAMEHGKHEVSRYAHEYSRVAATFDNANALAIFLCLTFPIVLYCVDKKLFSRRMASILLIAIIAGVAATGSRKGIVGLGMSLALYSFMTRKIKRLLFIILVTILLGGGLAIKSHIIQRFETQKVEYELGARWSAAAIGLRMFVENPLIGLGYQGYVDNSMKYRGVTSGRALDAHNVYITLLANYGLLGFLPFMAILFYPLIVSRRIIRRIKYKKEGDHASDMAVICISAMIPFMISAWFSGGLLGNWQVLNLAYTIIIFVLAGIAMKNMKENEGVCNVGETSISHLKAIGETQNTSAYSRWRAN